jgi:protein-arginine kinase activator protein McsA
VNCSHCGTAFLPMRADNRFCSTTCRLESHLAAKRKLLAQQVNCSHCGASFAPYSSVSRFCCTDCRAAWHRSSKIRSSRNCLNGR